MPLNEWTERFLKDPLGVARQRSISPPHGYQAVMRPGTGLYYGVGSSKPIDIGGKSSQLFSSKYRDKVVAADGEYRQSTVEVPTGMLSLELASGLNEGGLTFNINQIDKTALEAEMQKEAGRAALRGHYTWAQRDKIPRLFSALAIEVSVVAQHPGIQ